MKLHIMTPIEYALANAHIQKVMENSAPTHWVWWRGVVISPTKPNIV